MDEEGTDSTQRPRNGHSSAQEENGATDGDKSSDKEGEATLGEAQVAALLKGLAKLTRGEPLPPAQLDPSRLTGVEEERENEEPRPIVGNPVLVKGRWLQLQLKREEIRGRLSIVMVGLVGMVLLGTVIASFRLPAAENVEELKNLGAVLIPVTVGALAGYYFSKK